MIVLDASLLIAHLHAGDAHHEEAEELLAGTGRARLGASTITLAEILVAPARQGKLEPAWAAVKKLGVEEIPVMADSAPRLAELRAKTGLKMPDCCVLEAAGRNNAKVATFDKSLANAAKGIGLTRSTD